MRAAREAEYTEYVQARLGWLRRTAYLLGHGGIDQPGKHEQQICSRPNALVQPDGLHVWVYLDEPSPLGDAFAVFHRMGLDGTDPTACAAKPLG